MTIAVTTLESVIRERVTLGVLNRTGFYSLKCACCGDYKTRAGFKFDSGKVVYNCYNCSTSCVYEENSCKISKKFRSVLNAYGIDDTEISAVVNSAFFTQSQEPDSISLASLTAVSTATPSTSLPPRARRLGDELGGEHEAAQLAIINYLESRRVDLEQYTFYYSPEPRFRDRVIIPFWRNGRLIYWTARSIDPNEKNRWDNCTESRTAVIFGCDELSYSSPIPLLVCEGIFDAMMFNGIALLGNRINEAKLELLKNSKRNLVFVIDSDPAGAILAREALAQGWRITFTPEGTKDVNESVQRYGRTYTARQLYNNMSTSQADAELKIKLYCRKNK